ncbi:MAG: hypothetical protein M0002_06175 [Rhodospirillales bacterium]|nr:hypothetical protein [Rhodospirillales bacterium]
MRLLPALLAVGVALALTLAAPADGASRKYISLGGVQHFSSLAEAQKSCGKDAVVWANLRSYVYHLPGSRWFGKTKKGAYFCRSAVEKAGVHASKE